jgi:hypothetical protein
MTYGKYIIKEILGTEVAILFDPLINHCDIITEGNSKKAISAGFFIVLGLPSDHDIGDISVSVFGESITLKLKVRTNVDEKLIKRVLRKEY